MASDDPSDSFADSNFDQSASDIVAPATDAAAPAVDAGSAPAETDSEPMVEKKSLFANFTLRHGLLLLSSLFTGMAILMLIMEYSKYRN